MLKSKIRGQTFPQKGFVFIYVLIDPRDNEIRYIGVTKRTLEERLDLHMRCKKDQSHRRWWAQKLVRMGLKAKIDVVQQVPINCAAQAEIYWISYFKSIGCDLTNSTIGGEGTWGFKPSEKQNHNQSVRMKKWFSEDSKRRKAVSLVHKGKAISESHKNIVSQAAKKRWEEWRANGRYTTPETRAKIGASKKGRKQSLSARLKMSAWRKGRPKSPEHRAKLAEICRRNSIKIAERIAETRKSYAENI